MYLTSLSILLRSITLKSTRLVARDITSALYNAAPCLIVSPLSSVTLSSLTLTLSSVVSSLVSSAPPPLSSFKNGLGAVGFSINAPASGKSKSSRICASSVSVCCAALPDTISFHTLTSSTNSLSVKGLNLKLSHSSSP